MSKSCLKTSRNDQICDISSISRRSCGFVSVSPEGGRIIWGGGYVVHQKSACLVLRKHMGISIVNQWKIPFKRHSHSLKLICVCIFETKKNGEKHHHSFKIRGGVITAKIIPNYTGLCGNYAGLCEIIRKLQSKSEQ